MADKWGLRLRQAEYEPFIHNDPDVNLVDLANGQCEESEADIIDDGEFNRVLDVLCRYSPPLNAVNT